MVQDVQPVQFQGPVEMVAQTISTINPVETPVDQLPEAPVVSL